MAGFDIPAALEEVQQKDEKTIERETAMKWASRSMAVFVLAAREVDPVKKCKLLDWGDDLFHEAAEHAALVKDYGKTVKVVQKAIEKYRDRVVSD